MTEQPIIWELVPSRTKLTRKQVVELYLRQDGRCPLCSQKLQTKGHLPVNVMDEHILARWRGGSEELKNRALVCRPCGRKKTSQEAPELAKSRRARDKHIYALTSKSPLPFGRGSKLKKRMDGSVVNRETGEKIR